MHKRISILMLCVYTSLVSAQDTQKPAIYEAPKVTEYVEPRYPMVEAGNESEGWVLVNYMVDTNGDVFEPTIASSTGSRRFEDAALRAIEKTKFIPANIDGQPVEASGYLRYVFAFDSGASGARRSFVSAYKNFMSAIENRDKDAAENYLKKLTGRETLNHYEQAYLGFAQSMYAELNGTKLKQMEYLERALMASSYYDNGDEFLPKDLALSALKQLFILQVENKYYGEAVKTYKLLQKKNSGEVPDAFDAAFRQLVELAENEVQYSVEANTGENGYWSVLLHKRGFHVSAGDTGLSELKLRCEKRYVFFQQREENQYHVPDSWGHCSLEILGDANVDFVLTQFKPS